MKKIQLRHNAEKGVFMYNLVRGIEIQGVSVVYKKEGLEVIKGLLFCDGEEKWFKQAYLGNFYCGLAIYDDNARTGFVNRQGEFVIPPKYFKGDDFSEDRAFLTTGSDSILINTKGKQIKIWDECFLDTGFNDGFCRLYKLSNDCNFVSSALIDKQGDFVTPFLPEEEVTRPDFLIDPNSVYSNGMIRIRINNKYGFINKNCDIKIPFIYNWASRFQSGLAVIKTDEGFGIINRQNEIIIEPVNRNAIGLNNGFGFIKDLKNWHMINPLGDKIHKMPSEIMITNNLIPEHIVFEIKGKQGLMDYNLNTIFSPRYDRIHDYNEGILKFRLNNRIGVADRNGNEIISDIVAGSEYIFSTN
jgi:hypothetical protein